MTQSSDMPPTNNALISAAPGEASQDGGATPPPQATQLTQTQTNTHPQTNALERLKHAATPATDQDAPLLRRGGIVNEIHRTHYTVTGLSKTVRLGEHVSICQDGKIHLGEVISIHAETVTVKPFTELASSGLGQVAWVNEGLTLAPDDSWKGRVINAYADAIDGKSTLYDGPQPRLIDEEPPAPMFRQKVNKPVKTGVRVIDVFAPLCAGQRIGIFAGSGVGKSSLLAMLTKGEDFDTIVIALVGERGREVREFIDEFPEEQRKKTITVVSSGAESAMMRRLAPKTATCVAEHFRDKGERVLLIIDSLTRYAHASREVSLAAGEPPVARGFTPSVFADLPRLLERSGPGVEGSGSITGIFTVLIDADDHNDPIADCVRGVLDGHIVLDRAIADSGRYPPVNILGSVSRLADMAWSSEQKNLVMKLKAMIARYEETRDLRAMGAYKPGADQELDHAINLVPTVLAGLTQLKGEALSHDAFQDLAQHLSAKQQNDQSAAPNT